jgi:hypothetical protein
MVFKGHIENGVVVFPQPVSLPNGTPVRVEAVLPLPRTDFWESCSLDELARRQGVSVPRSMEEMQGGWPDDELADGFENAVRTWREGELEQAP